MGATVQLLNCGAQIARAFGGRCFSVSCGSHYDFQSVAAYPAPLLQRFLGLLRIFAGLRVEVFPCDSSAEDWMKDNDFVFLSNGPGDPSALDDMVSEIKKVVGVKPIVGICLGHQILGLALGGSTFKLGYGHRGLNHPCGGSGLVEITSQNHGFALDANSLDPQRVAITHHNLNDRTVAGLELRDQPVFGVQYHPEASPGPHDADHHFARFINLMASRRNADKIERLS